ncbi:flagellar hook-length control protein FliK [Sulfitobacter sp. M368]|uniref:flagellar hook-length control protein FliK n=1 Tax=Sulfitobacter sp. M368 TaxID=2867021 RepID=UPI0021A66C80|nr:flagellar hook-length control protein FliK [Sulfitobacter sp. M368]UWR17462.1 flagellar hook-length control protein FliK [Sulfitobacter sp. M368]
MLNLVFPNTSTTKGTGSPSANAGATTLPAGFGVMVKTATGTATVDAAALVTGAIAAPSQTGQAVASLSMPFLGAAVQTAETLIPEGALVPDPQAPETGVAVPAPVVAGIAPQQILPDLGTEAGQVSAQIMPGAAHTIETGETTKAAVQPVVLASVPPAVAGEMQTQTTIDTVVPPSAKITPPAGAVPVLTQSPVGPSPLPTTGKAETSAATAIQHVPTAPGPAQPSVQVTATIENAPQSSANLNLATTTTAPDVSVTAEPAAPKGETPKIAVPPQAAVPMKQAVSQGQPVVNVTDDTASETQLGQARQIATQAVVSTASERTNFSVEKQPITAAAQLKVKPVGASVPTQITPLENASKQVPTTVPLPVQATGVAKTAQVVKAASAAPANSAANAPVVSNTVQPNVPAAANPVLSEQGPSVETEAKHPAPVNTPAIAAKPEGLGVPATPAPKSVAVAVPAGVVAPTTNEQAQSVTPTAVAEKATGTPTAPAQISTIQAVTAQRNLVRPAQATNQTSKPAVAKPETVQPQAPTRAETQQSVFEAPTGQQPVVQAKTETALTPVAGPIGAVFEPIDPTLAPRSDGAPVQGFDPASAAKLAAPQEAAPKAPPKPFAEALISQVKSVEVSEGRTSVSLHPRGLGNIEIEVVTEKDAASKVVVRVENPAVLQSLRDERDLLAQAIGLSDGSVLEFHDHQPNDPSGGQGGHSRSSGQSGETSLTADTAPQHTDVVGDGQLDILT